MNVIHSTALTASGDLLQIWGHKDPNTIQVIERTLEDAAAHYIRMPYPDISTLATDTRCIAWNTDGKFYRARIVSGVGSNLISIYTLDYGFSFIIDARNIRILGSADSIMLYPPQAEGFFIAGVQNHPNCSLDQLRPDVVNQTLTVQAVADLGVNFRIARFFKGPIDITNAWLEQNKVKNILQRQQETIIMNMRARLSQNREPPVGATTVPVAGVQRAPVPYSAPVKTYNHQSYVKTQTVKEPVVKAEPAETIVPSIPPPLPAQFRVIPIIGSATYSVCVSNISEGPWLFSVQLKTDLGTLKEITKELNSAPRTALKPPFALGKPCIAYYSAKRILCRGVIVGISHKGINVSFVDYGNVEDVAPAHIFEPPAFAFKTKTLAHNFSLIKITQMKIPQDEVPELIKIFNDIVTDEEFLRMQVSEAEENCMQTCDLFVGNTNVKNLLNQRLQTRRRYVLEQFPAIGRKESVYVTHVEGVHKFYVQLRKRESDIEKLSEDVQAHSLESVLLREEDLRPGMPCLGQFLEDMQWYRGKLISIAEDSVKVFFVDYGNDMEAAPSSLKQIAPEFVKRLPAQALLCELNGASPSDEDIIKILVNIVNEDSVTMVVKSVEKNLMSVSLSKAGVDLISLSAASKKTSPSYDPAPIRREQVAEVSRNPIGGSRQANEDDQQWNNNSDRHHRENWRKRDKSENYDRRNRPFNDHRRSSRNDERGGSKFGFNRREAENGDDGGGRFGGKGGFQKREEGGFNRREDGDGGSRFGGKSFGRRDEGESGGFGRRNENGDDGGFGGKSRNPRRDNEESGGGGFKSFSSGNEGGGFKSGGGGNEGGGFKSFGGGNDGGAFKSGGNEGGGFKSFGGGNDGGGFKSGGNEGGGFKSFGGGNDGGGFKSFGNAAGNDSGRNERQDDRPRREPIRNEERAPAGSIFEEPALEAEATVEGILTCFVTPSSFFVQTQNNSSRFSEIMQTMQQDYVNKFSIRETDPIEEGAIVVAKFSEDRCLYRAEVVSSSPLTVRFVDYGNLDTINNRRDVYPVFKKLLDLPMQALHCSLAGIKPIDDAWTPDASRVFQIENVSLKLLSQEGQVWQVIATSDGKDLAEQLIAEGLAVSTSAAAQGEASPAGAAEEPTEDKILRIDCDLLLGELCVGDIPYVYSVDKFYIQLHASSVEELQTMITEQLAEPDARKALEVSAVAPGILCIASTLDEPDVLYRAKVVQLIETGALVQFIDYGDLAEVPFTQIFEISEELLVWPDLAIECSLKGDFTSISDEAQDEFKTELEGSQGIILVHEVDKTGDNPRLKVTFYTMNGKKQKVQEGLNDSPDECGLPAVPLIASKMVLNILDFMSTSTVLIQLPAGDDMILDEPEAGEVAPDVPSAVLCPDGSWRRGVAAEGSAFLVDTGFVDPVTDIRPLPAAMRGVPCVVREVAFKYPLLGVRQVTVSRGETGLVIDQVVKTGFISHVETATLVYFTPEAVSTRLDEIQATIATTEAQATEEELLVAKFPEDELWYRAKVLEREPLRVQFIDYGNSTEVTEVAPMPEDLAIVPPLAVAISLPVELPEAAKEQLEELVASTENPLTLVEIEGRAVDFLLNGRSVIAQLKGQPELFSGSTVMVSHVVDASELYLQREIDTQALTEMEERLAEAASFEVVTGPTEDLVAAEFEDGAWYRARFQNEQLYFVDFGNTAEPGELRALPADLAAIPPMAVRVSLIPAENTEDPLQLQPGGPVLTDMLNMPLRLQEVTSVDGALSVRLVDATASRSRSRPPRDTRDQTDDDKSVGMSRNETDEEKTGKMRTLVNVPDSDLEAAQLDETAAVPQLEFEVPDDDQLLEARHPVDNVMSPTTSIPDDALSQQSEETRGIPDEELIAESVPVASTSLSDEDRLLRDETLASQDSVPDDELISNEGFTRGLVEEVVSSVGVNQTDDAEAGVDVLEEPSDTEITEISTETEEVMPNEESTSQQEVEAYAVVEPIDSEITEISTETEEVIPNEGKASSQEVEASADVEALDVSREIDDLANSEATVSDEALLQQYESLSQEAINDTQNESSEEIAKSLGIEDVGNVNEEVPADVEESTVGNDLNVSVESTKEDPSVESEEYVTGDEESVPSQSTVKANVLDESFSSADFLTDSAGIETAREVSTPVDEVEADTTENTPTEQSSTVVEVTESFVAKLDDSYDLPTSTIPNDSKTEVVIIQGDENNEENLPKPSVSEKVEEEVAPADVSDESKLEDSSERAESNPTGLEETTAKVVADNQSDDSNVTEIGTKPAESLNESLGNDSLVNGNASKLSDSSDVKETEDTVEDLPSENAGADSEKAAPKSGESSDETPKSSKKNKKKKKKASK